MHRPQGLGEGVGTMRPKEENVVDKTQPETEFSESRVKEILFKETHEHVSIGAIRVSMAIPLTWR